MIDWIYELPLGWAAFWMAIIFVGFAWIGNVIVAPLFRALVRTRRGTNEIVGNISSNFGVLYGILLGLTAVAAYQTWDDAKLRTTAEAGALASLYTDSIAYPSLFREDFQDALRELLRYEIEEEWPKLKDGLPEAGAGDRLELVRRKLLSFEPKTSSEELVHAAAVEHFNAYLLERRLRLYSVTAGMPSVLWYVVIIGSMINIFLIWLLNMRIVTQFLLGGVLAFFLGAMILLIARLDKPFKTDEGVSPGALQVVYQHMLKDQQSRQ